MFAPEAVLYAVLAPEAVFKFGIYVFVLNIYFSYLTFGFCHRFYRLLYTGYAVGFYLLGFIQLGNT